MQKLLLPLLAVGALSVSTASAQLISDTFSSSFSNFTAQNTLGAAGMAWNGANGVGGVSGRINTSGTGNHNNAVYYSGSGSELTKNFTDTFTATVYFLTGATVTSDIFQVSTGFLRSTGSAFNTGAGGYAVWGLMRNDGAGLSLRLTQTGGQIGASSSTFSLAANTWYALQTSLTLSANATASSISVSIFNVGANGTGSFGSPLASITASNVALPNSGFSGNLWAGFGGGNNGGATIAAFDNFSVAAIPEPSAFAALAGLGALGLAATRRRRRA